MKSSLLELYESHKGFVSDKWYSYLTEYQRLLAPYQALDITLVEIGVQNGGSLQIWEKFFPYASLILGCDIEDNCRHLPFNSSIINIVIGDSAKNETIQQILDLTKNNIDIVIDDGSHISSDIISTFFSLFPAVKCGGVFIAEDLHCSYWPDFEGGLKKTNSSIEFFKALADLVNHEHWGTRQSRVEYLKSSFPQTTDCESVLAEIHSVEFVNSLCVVRKCSPDKNTLGARIIVGSEETVCPVKLKQGEFSKPLV